MLKPQASAPLLTCYDACSLHTLQSGQRYWAHNAEADNLSRRLAAKGQGACGEEEVDLLTMTNSAVGSFDQAIARGGTCK